MQTGCSKPCGGPRQILGSDIFMFSHRKVPDNVVNTSGVQIVNRGPIGKHIHVTSIYP